MNESLYRIESRAIVMVLLVIVLGAIEVGLVYGRKHSAKTSDVTKGQVVSAASTLIGILALLIGFTFTLSVQRFDSRSEAVVSEANAIGTAYLRSDLLPQSIRTPVRQLMREYIEARIAESLTEIEDSTRTTLLKSAEADQVKLWQQATLAAKAEPNPVTTGLFIQALNDMIDSYSSHQAALNRHVPEDVLLFLFAVFLAAAGVAGYASGVNGVRPSGTTYVPLVVIAILVHIILDIDRPRRGQIHVSQASMEQLWDSVKSFPQ